ncbi:serine protease 7-like [Episyrphus balteatus]|uniref:serine protease 7-like n=1 Tax=Episyrphus balteatus TaxID=286459 RepID=UPI0024867CED|nr:serine protease 7-like [Episyrphus balteatus]
MNTVNFASFSFLFFSIAISVFADKDCLNPNQRKGYCITIAECPVLKALGEKASPTPEERQFLSDSVCTDGFGEVPYVCCTTDTNYKDPAINQRLSNDLLPGPEICGDQPSGSKIYSGKETEIDEFPWMALFNYGTDEEPIFGCAGSIINSRYIITAAHCIVEKPNINSIRLGEYDTENNGIDCIGTDCADPVLNVFIESIIIHPNYNIKSRHRHNDIALIRVKDEIQYTSFISPVCMPWVLKLNPSEVGKNLVVAGWGRTLKDKKSSIKQKVAVPIGEHLACQQAFWRAKVILLQSQQVCAGGNFLEDACDGDSGGPLMVFKGKWAIEGIVSYSRGCGLEVPGVYTRVAGYEDWIVSSLKE